MPVLYEELAGSPEYDVERPVMSGRRRVKIAWADVSAFAAEIFPNPLLTGYLYGASLPGFPWVVATKLKIKPFVESRPRADVDDWTAWHDFALVEVEYGIPKDDQQQQSGPSGDKTGHGGTSGSNGGQEVTFLSHKVNVGGEFITWPADAVAWEKPANPPPDPGAEEANPQNQVPPVINFQTVLRADMDNLTTSVNVVFFHFPERQNLVLTIDTEKMLVVGIVMNRDRSITFNVRRAHDNTAAAAHTQGAVVTVGAPAAQAEKDKTAGENVQAAVSIPLIEHTVEWNYVALPPWLAMRQLMGKVNAYWFAGAPPETALFLGAECSRDITSAGVKCWKMAYKLSEKNMNAFNPFDAQGWNHFLRPTGRYAGTFQRLARKVRQEDGKPPTTTVKISQLSTDTTIKVNDTTHPFPQTGQFIIKVDNEFMAVTGLVAAGQWSVLRGVQGSTISAHVKDVDVIQTAGGVYELGDMRYLFLI